jgi:two-component system, chemotaxis family, protein-glutamate methylesterase/glutaminase
MTKIRVLVVEDSPTVRHRLREVLASDPDLDLAGEATDGQQAVDLCRRYRPDVITMDMMLPVLTGLAATEQIMARWPTPILVVSSSTNRAELFNTYDALAAGAVDVLDKPHGDERDNEWEQRLLATVKLVSRIRVITHPRARLSTRVDRVAPADPGGNRACAVVAIGASTGGPSAVVDALRALPAGFAVPVLLVQHIAAPFAASFAEWLGTQVGRPVSLPRDGDQVSAFAGRVALAPADRHLVVRNSRLWLTADPERHSCRPSVDVLFETVAREYGPVAAGCVLTGMGRDGAAGLLAIRRAGGLTFAQDEATSAVYGMPREAVSLGAAVHVLSPGEIGRRIGRLTSAGTP